MIPLTSDLLIAAFAASGVNGDNANAIVGGSVTLVTGLAALGVNTPEATTAFLTTASRLVQRELLTSKISALQAAAKAAAQASTAQQQALQQQISTLEAQIGGP